MRQLYENIFPLEKLLPDLKVQDILKIVSDCDYTEEANKICDADEIPNRVNVADAEVFYAMGYNAAQAEISKKLKLIK